MNDRTHRQVFEGRRRRLSLGGQQKQGVQDNADIKQGVGGYGKDNDGGPHFKKIFNRTPLLLKAGLAGFMAAAISVSLLAFASEGAEGKAQIKATSTTYTAVETSWADIYMIARTIWGEARGIGSDTQKAAVVWCILNRVDNAGFPDTISGVILQKNQFTGYSPSFPATDDNVYITLDVLRRWEAEKAGESDVGRVLPKEYLYFSGDGKANYFSTGWRGGSIWDWSLPSPYNN